MEACGLKQSKLNSCLFIGPTVIAVMYNDDVLFWSANKDSIYKIGTKLRDKEVQLEAEGDAVGFMGVYLEQLPNGHIHRSQQGLIRRIMSAVGMNMQETKKRQGWIRRLHLQLGGGPRS